MSEPINKIVPIGKIKPHPENYNLHPDSQLKQLGASYTELGQFRSVVLWAQTDGSYIQLAGHGVVEAMQREGATEVRADILPSSLDPVVAKRIMLADNLHAQNSTPDDELLAALLQEQQDAGFDLAALGSSDETLRQMLAELGDGYLGAGEQEEGDGGDDFDVEPEEGPTRTHVGELWQLGEHRLFVGDSTIPANFQRLMNDKLADLVFTDPPYNVNVAGGTHDPRDKKNFGKGPKIQNDAMSAEDFKSFLLKIFRNIIGITRPGASIYVCHADTEGIAFRTSFVETGWNLAQCLIWAKQQFVFGRSDYHWQHEPILYGWKPGAGHNFYGERNQSTVWNIDRPMRSEMEHPTQKPLALPQKAIENSSQDNDIVFDPFLGGGSTLIASHRLGRRCYGCELDPRYADVILARYEAETGEEATLLERSEEVAHA